VAEAPPLEQAARNARVLAARARLRVAADVLTDEDALLVAELVTLAPLRELVSGFRSEVNVEPGDGPGTIGLRGATSPEMSARADLLQALRAIARWKRLPFAGPYDMGKRGG
jgi:hypothetical protein